MDLISVLYGFIIGVLFATNRSFDRWIENRTSCNIRVKKGTVAVVSMHDSQDMKTLGIKVEKQ